MELELTLSKFEKDELKNRIADALRSQKEINKIVVFGSFLQSDTPNDIDLAVFQNSNENYLSLSLKYRKMIREISRQIPIDVIPIKNDKTNDFILSEIENGEVIYERGY